MTALRPRVAVWAVIAGCVCLAAASAHAQSISIDLGAKDASGETSRILQLVVLVGVLSLAPSLLMMTTCFTRIVIVLSLLRGALGTQGTPPNTVLIGLALFLSFFVMEPTLDRAWREGLAPLNAGQVSEADGLSRAAAPFHDFMAANVRGPDVRLFADLAKEQAPDSAAHASWRVLLPAFLVSEMRRAFEMGFLLYLPFLVIDMVVAGVLMSLGMMMLPPNVISLPFKLIFFVLVDGWALVSGSLVRSFLSGS